MKKILLMLAVIVASTGMLSAQSVTKQNPTTESLIQQWQQKTRLPVTQTSLRVLHHLFLLNKIRDFQSPVRCGRSLF